MLIRFINISFLSIFFLFGFFQNTHAQKNDTAIQSNNIANQIAVEQALTKNFVMYLKNITKVLHVDRSNVTPVMLKHVLRVEELFTRIERGFAQGAFASNPLIKKRFEILFTTIDATSWPTPAMIRKWQKDLDSYKEFLLASYFSVRTASTQVIDYETIDALLVLHTELSQNILTDDFFDFSLWELLADIAVVQPIEFTKENPLLVLGGVVALAAAGYGIYYYVTEIQGAEEKALKEWEKKAGAKLVIGSQEEAECGAWAMYRQWCHQRANGDMKEYERLACDDKTYARFKGVIQNILRNHRQVEVEIDCRSARSKKQPRKASEAWLKNINYLDTDEIELVMKALQASAEEDEFHLGNLDNVMVLPYKKLQDDEEVFYRDRELVNTDGTAKVYTQDAVPEARIKYCDVVKRSAFRDGGGFDRCAKRFLANPGNMCDFIVVLNEVPQLAREHWASGNVYNPEMRGHYFHIRAINNLEAEQGVEFVVSDTFAPGRVALRRYAGILANIRNLLRPYGDKETEEA